MKLIHSFKKARSTGFSTRMRTAFAANPPQPAAAEEVGVDSPKERSGPCFCASAPYRERLVGRGLRCGREMIAENDDGEWPGLVHIVHSGLDAGAPRGAGRRPNGRRFLSRQN